MQPETLQTLGVVRVPDLASTGGAARWPGPAYSTALTIDGRALQPDKNELIAHYRGNWEPETHRTARCRARGAGRSGGSAGTATATATGAASATTNGDSGGSTAKVAFSGDDLVVE